MAVSGIKKRTIKSGNTVLILCPLIDSCSKECSLYKKYERLGYNIVCKHPGRVKGKGNDELINEVVGRVKEVQAVVNDYMKTLYYVGGRGKESREKKKTRKRKSRKKKHKHKTRKKRTKHTKKR